VPHPTILPAVPAQGPRLAACFIVAALTFACYSATLLPGLDFGDTAAYQTAVGDWRLTPRQAYPLYYAIANTIFAVTGGEPAHSLNLTSALAGGAACGALVWVASALTGSVMAGVWAGLLLGASYTFWSQAIIGEVYTLHVLLVSTVLAAALWWHRRPSLPRLAVLFGLYALGFGNHLMMVLLAPPLVALIVLTPGGPRQVFSARGVGLAVACAVLGASQYAWNAAYFWQVADSAPSLAEGVRTFWFDVTKSDWRSTMVMGVHETALKRRVGLYWFDLQQQVGLAGIVLSLVGLASLWRQWRILAVLVVAYLTAFGFAYTYNVGDVHVFFLPSHQIVILAAAAGVAAVWKVPALIPASGRAAAAVILTIALFAVPAWRIWDTWPAVDRHDDRRPVAWLEGLTRGVGANGLLLADINWQLDNGLDYYIRHVRPDLNLARVTDRVLTLPLLVQANLAAGNDVVMTPESRRLAEAAYGGLFAFAPDPRVDVRPLVARLGALPADTIYVLALLAPYRDLPFDAQELADAARRLTGGAATLAEGPSYQVLAGRLGEPPTLDRRETQPFRAAVLLDGVELDVRMESWLPADTIRRAGFGHVIANRRHVLTLERGVSLVLLGPDGRTRDVAYASGLFAPLPRVLTRLAPAHPGP
jgi:Protein of unknown function (DUF2723)